MVVVEVQDEEDEETRVVTGRMHALVCPFCRL